MCSLELPEEQFYYYNGKPTGYCKTCRAKWNTKNRAGWSTERRQQEKERKEKWRTQHGRNKNLSAIYQIKFGITIEQYKEQFDLQKGCCAICGRPQEEFTRRFAVDHDHVTRQVRKLLCCYCNQGLGHFRDSIELLEKAKQYLKEYKNA